MNSIILAALASIFSCRGERWDDDLTLPKQDYTGNQLRIDGYYYSITSNDNYQIFFYYKNGCVLYAGVVSPDDLSTSEQSYMDGTFYNAVKNYKHDWGRFTVEGATIKKEMWKPNTGPFEAYTSEGTILNDTTIKFTKTWRSCKPKKVSEYEQIYHFKKFAPKPDSTNTYTD